MTDRLLSEYRSLLPLKHLTMLAGAVRGSYYRRLKRPTDRPRRRSRDDRSIIAWLHRICAHETGYGYRRVTLQLRELGYKINHKCVLRLMRQEKLLWQVHRRFNAPTTDSRHHLPVYPNMLKSVVVRMLNQVWLSDITCIHCGRDRLCYLAVILDAFSRRCVGWALRRYQDTRLTLEALQRALHSRVPPLVHHSDRGRQYASEEYINVLKAHRIEVSMSRAGNPYDNAVAESFFKTLKTEEVDLQQYGSLEEARQSISNYVENRYNRHRLHSSLGYVAPATYETALPQHRIRTLNPRQSVSP
jgi:transposase InsO family protein